MMRENYPNFILRNIFFCILILILFGCSEKQKIKQIIVNDYNILIVPDLSNRIDQNLHPKPIHDTTIIYNLLDHAPDILKLQSRTTNVLDIYKIDFINRGILNSDSIQAKDVELNFRRFKGNLIGSSDYQRYQFKNDITKFKLGTKKIYDYSISHQSGSDVWNYFNETIIPSLLPSDGETVKLTTDNVQLNKKNKNIVVLFTDGYIENLNKHDGYTLNQEMISSIRSSFNNSKSDNLEKFIYSQPQYHIKPTQNNLSSLNIIIFEMIDRSLDSNGVAKNQPTDFQIMKVLWTKWLKDSGSKNIEIHQAFNKKEEAYERLSAFLVNLK